MQVVFSFYVFKLDGRLNLLVDNQSQ